MTRIYAFLIFGFAFVMGPVAHAVAVNCDRIVDADLDGAQSEIVLLGRQWFETYKDADELNDFRMSIIADGHLINPVSIMRKEVDMYAKIYPPYSERPKRILNGEIGRIRKISTLETALMNYHLRRTGGCGLMEFEAFVFTHPEKEAVVLYHTVFAISVRHTKLLHEKVDQVARAGYQLKSHIHNHPFLPRHKGLGNGGMLYPSGDHESGDTGTYIKLLSIYNVEEAVITNGFHSVVIPAEDFGKL